jgi:hypothetical protein
VNVSRPLTLVGVAIAGLVLTGCGAPVGVHPGAAAQVGDTSISMSKIDDTTSLYCKAYLPQIQQAQPPTRIPMRVLRQFVAASLSERALAKQLAATYDVQPTPDYAQQLTQITQQFATAPADQRAAVATVESGGPYLLSIQEAIGNKLLTADGQTPGSAKAQQQRGQVATEDWLRTHDLRTDPVFALDFTGGAFKPGPDQTSFALSPLAVAGQTTSSQPGSDYVDALTSSQLCG